MDKTRHRDLRVGATCGSVIRRVTISVITIAVIAAGWLVLAPKAVGGQSSLVVTNGTSMLPHFHANGLVVTRPEPSYHVGEVVAYHNQILHRVVMHRIVARDGNTFVFKGDNNSYADLYHPSTSDLVGKEWLYLPNGGRYLQFVRSPLIFGLSMAFVGIFAFAPAATRTRRRRRHHVVA